MRFGISLIPHAHPFLKEFLGCMVIEAGLSEPHTCETAFYARVCVSMLACLRPYTVNVYIQIFYEDRSRGAIACDGGL